VIGERERERVMRENEITVVDLVDLVDPTSSAHHLFANAPHIIRCTQRVLLLPHFLVCDSIVI